MESQPIDRSPHSRPGVRWILLVALLLLSFRSTQPAIAQSASIETHSDYQFGSQITFQAKIRADAPVDRAILFIQVEGEGDTREALVDVSPGGKILYRLDVTREPVRAFSTLTYWFEARLQGGEVLSSKKASFNYSDNRFNWQTRATPLFRVHWYVGDVDFAQDVLDVAAQGLQHVQSLLPLQVSNPIDIYVYATSAEMQATLNLASQGWVAAGHADPDLGIMVVTLPGGPDQRLLMEQRVPHELMHILLYQEMGPAYANLPGWLSEGLASGAELYPNPDYLALMNSTQAKDALLPISQLCGTFPRDASTAVLAYAEATSFTRFLLQQYGTSGLQMLIQKYRDGMECERGVEAALGVNLTQLERQWRREVFGEKYVLTALKKLAPWFILLLTILAAPLGLTLGGLRRRPLESSKASGMHGRRQPGAFP